MPNAADPKLVDRIDAALPQTQCARCGYPRCRAYAEAIARGEADFNQCSPGGDVTLNALARLLGVPPKPLNPAYGEYRPRRRAVIDESRCIGCRKCADVCPTDAIVGARGWMHTVIAELCTGCELCLPPCPLDCIDMVAVAVERHEGPWPEYAQAEASLWRARTEARLARRARESEQRGRRRTTRPRHPSLLAQAPPREQIRAEIQAAVARVRRKMNTDKRG